MKAPLRSFSRLPFGYGDVGGVASHFALLCSKQGPLESTMRRSRSFYGTRSEWATNDRSNEWIFALHNGTERGLGSLRSKIDAVDAKLGTRIDRLDAKSISLDANLSGRIDRLQRDMNRRFDRVADRFDRVDQRFDHLKRRVERLERKSASSSNIMFAASHVTIAVPL